MQRETTVDQVAFWRHDGVVYYVHTAADPGRAAVLVINALGPGRARRFAVLSRNESIGEAGWELDDQIRRSQAVEGILASAGLGGPSHREAWGTGPCRRIGFVA